MSNRDASRERGATLALAALGVVYGDIGTSPLYAMKEVFGGAHHPVPITPEAILGILSLIFWSLIVVVSVKYVVFIMRADNEGEGGIMALMALVLRGAEGKPYGRKLLLLSLFGAALFYGDGVITPAISVLSAVEGLEVATPAFRPFIVPITLAVLVILFAIQRQGTAKIGALFGPIMIVWFACLAVLGITSILDAPEVLGAVNPMHGLRFMTAHPAMGFFSLGGVVLVITGGEALYADMGHFGRQPVQIAWFGLVLPALVLNYFGQGALLLTHPDAVENPFYRLAPDWAVYPMVALSTVATVIASQAVISGAYSITRQAMQLGCCPRLQVQHTSSREMGQIYLPGINWTLCIAVAALVVGFGSSTRLAAAYGIAVTGTMVITTILASIVVHKLWGWGYLLTGLALGSLLVIDATFFAANALKIHEGGWFPLVFALGIFTLMTTWYRGRRMLHSRLEKEGMPLPEFIDSIGQSVVTVVPGMAVFLNTHVGHVPNALLHSLKHFKTLHGQVVFLTVFTSNVPRIPVNQQVAVERINNQFYQVKIYYGFMDDPNIPDALEWCAEQGLNIDPMDTSFFLGRETLIPSLGSGMNMWREKLFVAMFRNAGSAATYFKLPPNRVVELGTQVVL
jgi:KUP system potassium uptake protein